MTITFNYLQYLNLFSFLYIAIPLIISANFAIVISIFLFRAHKYRKEAIQSSSLLRVSAILILTFSLLPLVFPAISGSFEVGFEKFIIISYMIFIGLLLTLPFFIAYGVFFYIYGKRNKKEYNALLMIAGILWMTSYGIGIIFLNGNTLSIISILYGYSPFLSLIYLPIIVTLVIIRLNGFVLLIIHGIKYKDKNIMVVGILGLAVFITNFFYRIVTSYNPAYILI
ncbi:MAG: hypothetical protein ACFFBH_01695 [Promethearchaeota archaeon]